MLLNSDLPTEALVALRRQKLLAEGRHDAFTFVFECEADVSKLQCEIQETEETIANPPDYLQGPMSPNASPRVYKDGYLAGLKDALKILLQAEESQPQAQTRVAEPANPYNTRKTARAIKQPRKRTAKTSERSKRRKQKGTE